MAAATIHEETPQATDRQLVERTLAGDTQAFALLHRRYFARVYRLALYRCRSVQDAEDIASETFLRAIAHLPAFRFQGESLFPWLSRIASNLAADMGRQRAGTTLLSLDGPTADGVRALIEGITSGEAPDPHEWAERHEAQEMIRAAIAQLPPDQADAVLMRFGGDLPLKEIALALNKTEGAIKSLLHRALVSLRKSLLAGVREAEVFGHLRETATARAVTETSVPKTTMKSTHGRFNDLI